MDSCPECDRRPYLCFAHNEQAREREEDEYTLVLFAGYWARRLDREAAFIDRMAKDCYWWGWRVATGQMLLAKAKDMIDARTRVVDESLPIRAPMVACEIATDIATKAFEAGFESVRGRRRG